MRVLAISSLFPNSVYPNRGIFVLNRLKAVSRYADVKVINPIPWFPFCSRLDRYKDYDRIPRMETIEGIEVYHPRFFFVPLVLKVVIVFTYCLAVLPIALGLRKTWTYGLVDLHWTFPDLPAGRLLSRLLGVRQITTVRGMAALHLKKRTLGRTIVRRLLPKSDHVITLSDRLKRLCVSGGVSEKRVSTVRNGVDGSTFHRMDMEDCRKRLGIPPHKQVILGVGYATPNKGFDRIVNSLPAILRRYPEAELYLVGPNGAFAQGDVTTKLKQLAESLGVEEKVHFPGEARNRELTLWYNAANVFCLSSRSEGCPNVLLEALACGCPVVGTDVGAVSEVIEHEFMGSLVSNNTEGVQSGLLSVLSRSHDREQIASRMRQYDWEWCGRQVMEIFEQTLGEVPQAESERDRASSMHSTELARSSRELRSPASSTDEREA